MEEYSETVLTYSAIVQKCTEGSWSIDCRSGVSNRPGLIARLRDWRWSRISLNINAFSGPPPLAKLTAKGRVLNWTEGERPPGRD
jgi:hypothetical protein